MLNNHWVGEGNIGKDPEQKTTKTGSDMVFSSLAVYKNKEKTNWFTLKAFGSSAKMLFEAKKGEKVQVSGQIDIDEYEKDGVKRTSVCLIVDHCRVLPKSQMATGTQQPVATSKSEELPF